MGRGANRPETLIRPACDLCVEVENRPLSARCGRSSSVNIIDLGRELLFLLDAIHPPPSPSKTQNLDVRCVVSLKLAFISYADTQGYKPDDSPTLYESHNSLGPKNSQDSNHLWFDDLGTVAPNYYAEH